MRVHHMNCGTFCPWGGPLMDGATHSGRARLVCHCLLVESGAGLVLVDTGLGTRDVDAPRQRTSALLRCLLRPRLERAETAIAQIEALGFHPGDVRHAVLTHLDFDHAGGLDDFPRARVHVLAAEKRAAEERAGFLARRRYRPRQWDGVGSWALHGPGGERWNGFEAVRGEGGLPEGILLLPLPGHTRGHAGVAVESGTGWLLHAGDAYFHHGEMDPGRASCPPGLRLYQRMMEVDRRARLANQERLRALARERRQDLRVFCSHDATELEALAALGDAAGPPSTA